MSLKACPAPRPSMNELSTSGPERGASSIKVYQPAIRLREGNLERASGKANSTLGCVIRQGLGVRNYFPARGLHRGEFSTWDFNPAFTCPVTAGASGWGTAARLN